MGSVVPIETARTDAAAAKEYRERLGPLLDQVSALMGEAKAEGFLLGFNIQADSFGRNFRCIEITVNKVL